MKHHIRHARSHLWPELAGLLSCHIVLHAFIHSSSGIPIRPWATNWHEADDSRPVQLWVRMCQSLAPQLQPPSSDFQLTIPSRYLVAVPVILNLATLTGFVVIICVVGGQCLSAVAGGALTPTAGIVIIALLSLLISFCGFRVLHFYEAYAWIPAIIAIIIATGTGGAQLKNQSAMEPATAAQVFSYGMIVASYMIPWAAIASDVTTYFNPQGSS
jgi:hypothetical protein